MAGRFITFEGGEGAGKSTQIQRLAARLRQHGETVVLTREPGGTPLGEKLRAFILSGSAEALGPDTETMLFAAARADHVDRVIAPALARGEFVLCDRFIDSTRAYQGSNGADPALIEGLEKLAIGAAKPSLTLILDLPVEIGLARAAKRRGDLDVAVDRFERETLDRHEQRRRTFLAIAAAEPQRCVVIDANRSEQAISDTIWETVRNRLLETGS